MLNHVTLYRAPSPACHYKCQGGGVLCGQVRSMAKWPPPQSAIVERKGTPHIQLFIWHRKQMQKKNMVIRQSITRATHWSPFSSTRCVWYKSWNPSCSMLLDYCVDHVHGMDLWACIKWLILLHWCKWLRLWYVNEHPKYIYLACNHTIHKVHKNHTWIDLKYLEHLCTYTRHKFTSSK